MANKIELSIVAKNQASSVLKSIAGDIGKLESSAKSSKGSLSGMFDVAGGNLLSSGIKSATSAIMDMGRAFVGVAADAVNSAAEMNAQVSGIGAVLGLTTGELSKVKGLINQLGVNPNLKVNAQEAADAIDMLARNGLTLQQIMDGAAESTVFLANATGGDFESSANVATDVMAMFKIKAEDMMSAVNGITSVTVASKFSLNDYQLALAQAGGVASALGVNFDDFNATIASTSASFASGSDAGTSYKTFLQRLVPQSNEATEAMAELGLYTFSSEKAMATLSAAGVKPLSDDMNTLITQLMNTYAAQHDVDLSTEKGIKQFTEWSRQTGLVQNAFYDANGQMKSMADVSMILNKATAGLTEEQKNQYLTQIFGSDAMRTAFGLAEKGTVVYTDVAKASKELGVSQEVLASAMADGVITQFEALQVTMGKTDAYAAAQMRMDNLAGDMEIFGGIVDSVKMQLGDRLDPVLRSLFQAMTQGLTNLTPRILAFGDAMGVQITGAVKRITSAIAAFKGGGGITDIGKALGISPKALGYIKIAIANIDLLKGALKGIATAIAAAAAITAVASAIAGLMNPITLVIAGAALLGAAWETNFGGIQELTASAWAVVQPIFADIYNWAVANLPAAVEAMRGAFDTAWNTINTVVSDAWGAIQPHFSELYDWAQTTLPTSFESLKTSATNAWTAVKETVSTAWSSIQPTLSQFWTWLQFSLPLALASLGAAGKLAWDAVKNAVSTAWDTVLPILTDMSNWVQTDLPAALTSLQSSATTVWDSIKSSVSTAWGSIQPSLSEFWTWIQITLPVALATLGLAGSMAWSAIKSAVSTAWDAILPSLESFHAWAQTDLPGALTALQTSVTTAWDSIKSAVSTAWEAILPALSEFSTWALTTLPASLAFLGVAGAIAWNAIKSAVTTAWDTIQPALSNFYEWIQTTLPDSFTALSESGKAAWDAIKSTVTDAWSAIQPTLSQLWTWAQLTLPIALGTLGVVGKLAWDAIKSAVSDAWGVIEPALSKMGEWVQTTLPGAFTALQDGATTAWSAIQSSVTSAWGVIEPALSGMWTWMQISLPLALLTISAGGALAWNAIQTSVTSAWSVIQPALSELKEKMVAILEPIASVVAKFVSWKDVLTTAGVLITATITPAIASFVTAFVAAAAPVALTVAGIILAVSLLRNAWENNWGGIQEKTASAWAAMGTVFDSIKTAVSDISTSVSNTLSPSMTRLGESLTGAFSGLTELGPSFTALQDSISGMVNAVQPILAGLGIVIGAVFGVVSILAINNFSAIIDALPGAIKIAIDQLTETFNTISTTINDVISIVKNLLEGDFAGAWEDAKNLVSTSIGYMLSSITNLSLLGGLMFSSLKTVIVNTFTDIAGALGIDDIGTKLDGLKQKVTDFFTGEGNIFSTAFSIVVDAPAWLASLTGWKFPEIPKLNTDWWPGIPELLSDWWPDIPSLLSDWWPDIPMPGWITTLGNLLGVGASAAESAAAAVASAGPSGGGGGGYSNSNNAGGGGSRGFGATAAARNADGTNSFEGGWTWVGERGPELMNLPKGTKILSNTESKKMIANNADGTTTAAAAGNKPTNVFSVIRDAGAQFKKGSDVIEKSNKELAKVQKESMNDLKSALQKVPGLFGSSQVTEQQMKMGELGIPQNFADDYLRRLTDEVMNGVDWEGVDIGDAAARAGIDPNLPVDAILEIFKSKWDDKSLFANGNTDLINMEAVQAELAKQQQQKLGEANLLAMFGITPEQSTANGVAVGSSLGSGIQTGLSTSLSTGGAGEQIAKGLTGTVTPEQMSPVSTTVIDSLVTQIGDSANVDKVGGSLVALFNTYIEKPESFGDIGNSIMGKISAQMGNVTGIDMVAKFSDAFRQQLGAEEAMNSLANVGAKILELVFRGYLEASRAKNWAEGVNAKGKEETPPTPVLNGNAIGTSNWRGGLTWVGETGPEIVALPARSRIYSNNESMAMAGGGGDVHITIHATVNNGVDINDLAYRVMDIARRRR